MKKTVLIHIKIDDETYQNILESATVNYRSINNTVLMILHAYFDKQTNKE
jgi:hypothetical protein